MRSSAKRTLDAYVVVALNKLAKHCQVHCVLMPTAAQLSQVLTQNFGLVLVSPFFFYALYWIYREIRAILRNRSYPPVPPTDVESLRRRQEYVQATASRLANEEAIRQQEEAEQAALAGQERLRASLLQEDLARFGSAGRRLDGRAADDSAESLRLRALAAAGILG